MPLKKPSAADMVVLSAMVLLYGILTLVASWIPHRWVPGVWLGAVLIPVGAAGLALSLRRWAKYACLVFQLGPRGRVRHLHWPKAGIVNCRASVGFHVKRS